MAPRQMRSDPGGKQSLWEMITHPWATLRKIQRLDKFPDRRSTRTVAVGSDLDDPIRMNRAQAMQKALGVSALEENRIELYQNYAEMDTDSIIATVLDAYGDDACQYDPEQGRRVWVESDNPEIKAILTRTLDRLRFDDLAFPILRAMAKNGDHFEHLAVAKQEGVLALRAYEPWSVARLEDKIGRHIGFAPCDAQGLAVDVKKSSVPPYKVLHFRLQSRDRTKSYGVTSSFLWGSRIVWRELQLMEDQVVIQRLLRRPDRLLILMDAGGMTHDEAWMTMKRWERRFHREWYLNPSSQQFLSQGVALDGAKDMILPRGPNNGTSIENFPATNQNDLLRDLDMFLRRLAAGIGFPLGYVGRGEGGQYDGSRSLSRQYTPFGKRATRLQLAFLDEAVRMLKIDLAFKGLDSEDPSNRFSLHMASVAPIVETERAEIIQLRFDRMERAHRLGQDMGLDMTIWTPYVLEKLGGLSRSLVKALYKESGGEEGDSGGRGGGRGRWEGRQFSVKQMEELFEDHVGSVPSIVAPFKDQSVSVSSQDIFISHDMAKPKSNTLLESTDAHVGVLRTRSDGAEAMKASRHSRAKTRVTLLRSLCSLPEVPINGGNGSRLR